MCFGDVLDFGSTPTINLQRKIVVSELGYMMPSLCKKAESKSYELTFEVAETDNDTLAIQPNSDSIFIDRDA